MTNGPLHRLGIGAACALMACAGVAAPAGDAAAPTHYRARQLQVPEPGAELVPLALNNVGQVAAQAYIPSVGHVESFVTGRDGMGLMPLCPGGPACMVRAINDRGDVVGSRWNGGRGQQIAFIGHAGDGELHSLEGLQNDVAYSFANGINDDGVVVGETLRQGFRTGPDAKGYVDLGDLGDQRFKGAATAINDAGVIVGYSPGPDHLNVRRAYVTSTDVHRLVGLEQAPGLGHRSVPTAVGADGLIVGASGYHAVAWGKNRRVVDLGTLEGPAGASSASGVNSHGAIVGWSSTPDHETHAFVCDFGKRRMADLNALVDDLPPGTVLRVAYAINEHGQIAVLSTEGAAFLLTPKDDVAP